MFIYFTKVCRVQFCRSSAFHTQFHSLDNRLLCNNVKLLRDSSMKHNFWRAKRMTTLFNRGHLCVTVSTGFIKEVHIELRPWAPRAFLEFAIKTGYVLDLWKNILLTLCIFRRPWKFLNNCEIVQYSIEDTGKFSK